MTIGSLFSGAGGLELGLERAGLGPTLWQVEIDAKCRAVLERHWPDAERYDDIRGVDTAGLAAVDLICGGFPCQDLSAAGKRAGLGGARSGLWGEFRRIVGELLPRWVVVENVASGARNWVDAIRGDLEQLGYETLPIPLAACDVGAWHRRARVFVIAHRDPGQQQDDARWSFDADSCRSKQSDVSITASANIAAATGRDAADPQGDGLARTGSRQERAGRPVTEMRAWPDWNPWTAEPGVARVVHGLPGRVDREQMLGNAVVPQCAEVIGWVIRHLESV